MFCVCIACSMTEKMSIGWKSSESSLLAMSTVGVQGLYINKLAIETD